MSVGVVLLAAGSSTRMGQPKQLLTFQGESLLRRTARIAQELASPLVVVLGFRADQMLAELDGLRVTPARNPNWEEGMSSSIRCGVAALLEQEPQIDAVAILLTDQPKVTVADLRLLISTWDGVKRPIVASAYSGTSGPPIIFGRDFIPELLQLKGPGGARVILERHPEKVTTVDVPAAAWDLDTPEQYRQLNPRRVESEVHPPEVE